MDVRERGDSVKIKAKGKRIDFILHPSFFGLLENSPAAPQL